LPEHVFLPVTTKMIVSISEIVCIPELGSLVALVPHACDIWISVIREWRDTIALPDSCCRKGTGPGIRYTTWIHIWAAKHSRPGRTHCTGRIALAGINHPAAEAARRHGMH